jgi:peptidoglycan/xylan/chitin deacetylase (PgdA/CDA1 family)
MSAWRSLLRGLAYRSGALRLARSRQRAALTVVMLHRVIEPADADFALADPAYTLGLPLFVDLLEFLRRHYQIVSLADVMAAYNATAPLPDHALLITFDDGWADNFRYAAPALKSMGLPAVVFAVAEAVGSGADEWWQERVFAAARNGSLTAWLRKNDTNSDLADGSEPLALEVVTRLGAMDTAAREQLVCTLPALPCRTRMMLTAAELAELARYGIDVGLHGYNHVPLTSSPDVTAELLRAKTEIAIMSGGTSVGTALGCPHGRYDAAVVQGARAAGVKLVFTSDPWLNATRQGFLAPDRVLGRINLDGRHIADRFGRLDPSAAARWLWSRQLR